MSVTRQICRITTCVSILLGSMAVVTAQDRNPLLFEGGRIETQPAPAGRVELESEPQVRETIALTRESRRFLDRTTENAAVLARQSTSAFQRGLMPLTDYLNQLAIVEYVDVRAADLGGPRGRIAAYRRQVERLEDACGQLKAFDQPASEGWRGDAILTELALTEARLKLAEASGDTVSVALLRSSSEILARAHFQQRESDYQLGLSSLPMMAYAAKLSAGASLAGASDPNAASSLEQRKTRYLELVLTQTQDWSDVGAGIGRADRLGAARLDLAAGIAAEPPGLTPENVKLASREFAQHFEGQLEFYRHGTASLHDVSQTWVAWHDIHRSAAEDLPDALDEAQVARRGTALQELQSLAANVHDRRGRHAADVAFVQLAGQLDGLDELYTEVDPQVEYLP